MHIPRQHDDEYPAFMASAHLPFWNPRQRVAQSGLYCYACVHVKNEFYCSRKAEFRAVLRAYTIEQLPRHFFECGAISASEMGWNWIRGRPQIKGKPFSVEVDGTVKKNVSL